MTRFLLALALCSFASLARADDAIDVARILGLPSDAIRITSAAIRLTAYEQDGHGYQSKAGPIGGPGSERLTVFEPQLEVRATQGDRITHRIWVPIDVVTSASANAIDRGATPDVISNASRQNEAGSIDWTVDYKATPTTQISFRSAAHLEEEFRAWVVGMSVSQGFFEQNTVLTLGILSDLDWFDHFNLDGSRYGIARRSSNTGSLSLTQVLSPTTLVEASYGVTIQAGELGNTWNIVPLEDGTVDHELLPGSRLRQSVVGRIAQALPWNAVLKGYYRFYFDDWSIVAHTFEAQYLQHLGKRLYVGAGYRHHTQTGASFFTTRANFSMPFRTADSDLAPLDSDSITGRVGIDVPRGNEGTLHFDLAYERYVRSNDLAANVFTCSTAVLF
ncbi:MAG TPA: DUF3570 domain-containing protein [Polyangiaceae bacterium]|jgi:hypothetical protein